MIFNFIERVGKFTCLIVVNVKSFHTFTSLRFLEFSIAPNRCCHWKKMGKSVDVFFAITI